MITNKLFLSLLGHRDSELVILYHNYNNYIIIYTIKFKNIIFAKQETLNFIIYLKIR